MFTFRLAVRENVGLLIGLVGPSGGGKTYTALRLAKGMAGDAPFAVIDTEAGRAKFYADLFRFDHGDLMPPFRPSAYADAIKTADTAGYPVIVVDSCSHEYAGEGGILDWQEEELVRMAGDDWKKREACLLASWVKPKMAHKQMVQRLLQIRAHLILCLRAEEKIEMVKGPDGKMQVIPKRSFAGVNGWVPICEKTLPYELTVSVLLLPDRPGVPIPIKLQEQHRVLFPLDSVLTEDTGKHLAAWARGGKGAPQPLSAPPVPVQRTVPPSPQPRDDLFGSSPEAMSQAGLLGSIQGLMDKMRLTRSDRMALWAQHIGPSVSEADAPVLGLQSLQEALKRREGAKGGSHG